MVVSASFCTVAAASLMSGLQDVEIAVVVRGVGVVLLQCVPVSQAANGHGVEINSSDRT